MVSCQPSFQSYKIALKTCDQSVIEHNLVTIYLNLEWPDNISDNPNLLIHIFDKKFAPKLCKTEYLPPHLPLPFPHPSATSVSQPLEQYAVQAASHLPPPPSIPTGDHNDVSSTTTLYHTLPASSISPRAIPPLKVNPPTPTTTSTYRHQTSPPCSSSNQGYFAIEGDNQASPTLKSISPISSTNMSSQAAPALTHVIDIRQTPPNNNSHAMSSPFKAFLCSEMKPQLNAEQTCPTGPAILCRPANHHRSLAQRAAVASQIRSSNRSISLAPLKEQGQTTATVNPFFPPPPTIIANSPPAATKKPFARQRSLVSTNNRTRKRRISKQLSLPTDRSASTSLYKGTSEILSSPMKNLCSIKEEQMSPANTIVKSPRKLFSPFSAHSMQTTVSNSEIDQTIDEVISGKGEIALHESSPTYSAGAAAAAVAAAPPQPSSQLVWVQNGAVTTKTWLSPLYQKQPTPPLFDPQTSTLTHQDVVNIAQQVVFPSVNETTKVNNVVLPGSNSKRRNRSKSTGSTTTKRNRQRKPVATSPQPTTITPTLNLITKPVLPPPPPLTTSNGSDTLLTSMTLEKNDLWQNVDTMLDDFHLVAIDDQQRLSNLHSHFDFDLSIDRFPSSTPPPPSSSSTALAMSSSHGQHPFPGHPHHHPHHHHQGKWAGANVDVYEHFLNPLPVTSAAAWQENQVTSSVSTPPDFQLNSFPQTSSQTTQQQYFTSISEENFPSQVRLLFDVQS